MVPIINNREILTKKERKELRRQQRQEEIKKFKRLRRIQKIIFWTILSILVFGGLYVIMALVGYAYNVTNSYLANFVNQIYGYIRQPITATA